MPVIPTIASVPRLPQRPRGETYYRIAEQRAIVASLSQVGESFGRIAERHQQAEKQREYVRLSGEMEAAINDLQLSIEQDPSLDSVVAVQDAFAERAARIRDEAVEGATYDDVKVQLQNRFNTSSAGALFTLRRKGFQREADAAIAGMDRLSEQALLAYERSDVADQREHISEQYERDVRAGGYESEKQKENRIEAFRIAASSGYVTRLIREGRFDEARALLKDDEALPGLTEKMRLQLETSATIEQNRQEAEAKRVAKGLSDDKKQEFVARIFGQGPPLTMGEIFASNLTATEQEHYAELLKRWVNNPDLDVDNPLLVKSLVEQIDAGEITDPIELDTHLMDGVSRTTTDALKQMIEDRKQPGRKEIADLLGAHLRMAHDSIYMGTLFENSSLAAQKYNAYQFEKKAEIREMQERGASLAEIRLALDPSSPTYIGKDLDAYRITMDDWIADLERQGLSSGEAEFLKNHPEAVPTGEETLDGRPTYRLPNGKIVWRNE